MTRRTWLIIGGVVVLFLIVLGVGAFLLLPSITSANQGNATTPAPTVAATATRTLGPVAQALRTNRMTIKSQIAQALKLTPKELTAQLKAGKTLSDVATAQGITSTQLQTIISSAVTSSMQTEMNNGTLTQKQVNAIIKRFENKPQTLDVYLGGKAQNAQATPTPTATP